MYGPNLHLYLVGIRLLCMVQDFHLLPNVSYSSYQGSTETVRLCRLISVLAFAFADKYIMHNKLGNCFVWVSRSTSDLKFNLLS